MSVLIKSIEMPKGCAVCPYCDRNWSNPKCHAKSIKGRYMSQKLFLDSRRQDWCPLIEIPPHGRLIDADKLTELCDIMADKCDGIGESIWGQFRATVEWSPTIIEAEE